MQSSPSDASRSVWNGSLQMSGANASFSGTLTLWQSEHGYLHFLIGQILQFLLSHGPLSTSCTFRSISYASLIVHSYLFSSHLCSLILSIVFWTMVIAFAELACIINFFLEDCVWLVNGGLATLAIQYSLLSLMYCYFTLLNRPSLPRNRCHFLGK